MATIHMETVRRDTEWFASRQWGVLCHYLSSPETSAEDWNRQVDSFDVERLAGQLAEAGARYYFHHSRSGLGTLLHPERNL